MMDSSQDDKKIRVEYPDEAGYPDGAGFLDEGTAEHGDGTEKGAADGAGGDDIDDEVTDFEQELDGPDEDQVTGSA